MHQRASLRTRFIKWAKKFVFGTAQDRADRTVIRRRIATGLKRRESYESFLGTFLVGMLAGVLALVCVKFAEGTVRESAISFFKLATDVDIPAAFVSIGFASYLVASHVPPKKQWKARRLLALPLLGTFGDAYLLAAGAFTVVSGYLLWDSPILLGSGAEATPLHLKEAAENWGLFLYYALFTVLCRLIVNSSLDNGLFTDVHEHKPGTRRVLFRAGGGGFLAFGIVAAWLYSH